jgi:hypothetical protein
LTSENKSLVLLYTELRKIREALYKKKPDIKAINNYFKQLCQISDKLDSDFKYDWLSRLEVLELLKVVKMDNSELYIKIKHQLSDNQRNSHILKSLIQRGLDLIE